ncbi:bestrophin family ion channel [Stenotrophomonas sp. 24(2023)]|uniref:bestrophin family protein n=1 Tax=Stenotrophomonas sp. 24(2023) TaxID=3068324 RepID=UPI0027E07102|nr:bestrophin family ion channel [Stenotrophomonas sp. 24(2023)]WMJ70925.1 bestrophin family ion channel [Stenotrophomonas sp. 24(2023)]
MIIRPRPHGWQLLYILRGSIVPAVAPKVLSILVLAIAVAAVVELARPPGIERISAAPFTLLGLVLSIFLSFRNNACYERWWEGRKLWGQLVFESRSLARQLQLLLPDDGPRRQRVAYLATAFAHALAARLRGRDVALAAVPWLDEAQRAVLAQRQNVPDALLAMIGAELVQPLRAGTLDPILYAQFEERLHAMSSIQAGCERILSTPLPFAYTLLLHRCAWMFCVLLPFGLASSLGWATPVLSAVLAYAFFGLDQLGEEMEDPFGLEPNDLPLDALVRTIEIDQLDALGQRPLPDPLLPQGYLLQ